MKKNRNKLSKKIYPIIWSGIIAISLYLIFRFSTLSFTDDMGQADMSIQDAVFSGLCSKVMEEGAALISYSATDEHYNFPVKLAAGGMELQKYTDNTSIWTERTEAYAKSSNSSNPWNTEEAIETMNTKDAQGELGFFEIPLEYLSREYVLTNGMFYNSNMAGTSLSANSSDQLQVGYEEGEIYYEETEDSAASGDNLQSEAVSVDEVAQYTLDQLKDIRFLVSKFYIVDSSTEITKDLFDAEELLSLDMSMKQENDAPQILIYHTHSQESYIDSRADKQEDTVVGVGSYLTEILQNEYGYNVIHDTTTYDIVDGVENRNVAYSKAEDGLNKILEENPTIEVVIDLHRDDGKARIVEVDGVETAKIMLFNGLSRDQNGPITYLDNPNLQDNLAFSLQLQLKSKELYPGLFNKNYLKCYRYNMHVRPKSLLMELGTDENTVESAKNAMVPFAEVLDEILQGE